MASNFQGAKFYSFTDVSYRENCAHVHHNLESREPYSEDSFLKMLATVHCQATVAMHSVESHVWHWACIPVAQMNDKLHIWFKFFLLSRGSQGARDQTHKAAPTEHLGLSISH